MRTTHASRSFVFAAMLAVFTVVPAAVWSQSKNQGAENTPAPPKSKTRLAVDVGLRGTGESLVIHSPEVLTFRWSTSEEGVTYAFSEVFDTPPASSSNTAVSAQQSHPVFSNQIGVVKRGPVNTFVINFEQFANHTPPESPKRYYVRVVTLNAQDKSVGLPSPPVIITYSRAPGWKPAELGSEYCYVDVRQPYHQDQCALKYVNFNVIDPTLNRIDVPPDHPVHVMIKSAAAGRKYQVDCKLNAFGTKPFKISGLGIYNESVPQTEAGGTIHAIFIFESKNTEWVDFRVKNEGGMQFFNCKVTNLK